MFVPRTLRESDKPQRIESQQLADNPVRRSEGNAVALLCRVVTRSKTGAFELVQESFDDARIK